jgi:hypothetical protein
MKDTRQPSPYEPPKRSKPNGLYWVTIGTFIGICVHLAVQFWLFVAIWGYVSKVRQLEQRIQRLEEKK